MYTLSHNVETYVRQKFGKIVSCPTRKFIALCLHIGMYVQIVSRNIMYAALYRLLVRLTHKMHTLKNCEKSGQNVRKQECMFKSYVRHYLVHSNFLNVVL